MRIFGYIKEFFEDTNIEIQESALKNRNCQYFFQDGWNERKNLNKLLSDLKENDIVVVWRLDCFGRNLLQLLHILITIKNNGAFIVALNNGIDTTDEIVKNIFNKIISAFSDYEKYILSEGIKQDKQARIKKLEQIGRKRRLDRNQEERLCQLYYKVKMRVPEIADVMRVSIDTVYRTLKRLPPVIENDIVQEAK